MMNRVVRRAVVAAAVVAPAKHRIAIRRHARGWEDAYNLQRADFAVVSFGKSGRTWLSTMLSRYFQIRFNLPDDALLSFNNFHRRNPVVPSILFTHDNYIRDYTGNGSSKAAFYNKPTLLLARHPGDVAVSQFFQWRYRMLPHKKELNGYPAHGSDISVFDFVMHDAGLRATIRFLNEWAEELPRMKNILIVRYEDMRRDTRGEIKRILQWFGQNPTEAEIEDIVEYTSVENLRKLEANQTFRTAGKRMRPGDVGNPDSYKVRRAKVGGFRDYFSDEQVQQIESYIRANLNPIFGYAETPSAAAAKVGNAE
jgi:hypothetical protein